MLRDKFAMAAMQGIMASGIKDRIIVADLAYKQANAMMKERAKQDFSGDPDAIDVHIPAFGGPVSGYQPKKHPPKKP